MKHLLSITATLLLLLASPSRAQETQAQPAAQTPAPATTEPPAETPPAEAPATTETQAAETPAPAQAEEVPTPRTAAEIAADKIQIGTVAVIQGQLSATDAAGAKRALSNGSPIFRNEDIVSEANSRAQLLLTDDTLVAVAENTNFKISNYVFNGAEAPATTETPAAEPPTAAAPSAETAAVETPAAEAPTAAALATANGNAPPNIEVALGSVRVLGGKTDLSGEQGIKVLTPEAEVSAQGTMFKVTTTENGTAVGVYRGSVRVANPAGSVMLGKKGYFAYSILPAGDNGRPTGQLADPGALAALEATGTVPGGTVSVANAVSEDLKARFKLKPLSYTELHDLRRSIRVGGRFADRMMIKLRDRQVDLHSDGIECGSH